MQQIDMSCPKCRAPMQTHSRHGVHIEQCGRCRGIFLDFGELEALTQMQMQWMQQMAQAPAQAPISHTPPPPAWGAPQTAQPPPWSAPQAGYGHGYHKGHKRGLMGMLFSS